MNMIEGEKKAFSSIDFVGQCLVDTERTKLFCKAIKTALSKGGRVLELGTGSGILAAYAAIHGASDVVAVEYDPLVAELAQKTMHRNNLEDKVKVILGDATILDFKNDEKFDVIMAELLTTGMVDEPQIQAMNNLHDKGMIHENTILIPSKQDTYATLVSADYGFEGLKMDMILHLWNWHDWSGMKITDMTERELLNSIDFAKGKVEDEFSTTLTFTAKESGIMNGIKLTSVTFLGKDIVCEDTEALNAPVLIPLDDFAVQAGSTIAVSIKYIFGAGYGNFEAKVISG